MVEVFFTLWEIGCGCTEGIPDFFDQVSQANASLTCAAVICFLNVTIPPLPRHVITNVHTCIPFCAPPPPAPPPPPPHTHCHTHTRAWHSGIAMRSGFDLYHYGNRDLFVRPHKMFKPTVDFMTKQSRELAQHFSKLRRVMAHFTDPNPFARCNPSAQPTEEVMTRFDKEYDTLLSTTYDQDRPTDLSSITVRTVYNRLCKRSRADRGLGALQRKKRRIDPDQGEDTDANMSAVTSTASSA